MEQKTFRDLLLEWREAESVGTDDVLNVVLPLMKQVAETHQNNQVAPLNGVDDLLVSMGHLWFVNEKSKAPKQQNKKLKSLQKSNISAVVISAHYHETIDESFSQKDATLGARNDAGKMAYYPDYVSWELKLDHHDVLSDVFVLGLILGSLATRLDFTEVSELETFLARRHQLSHFYPRLSPVVAQIIENMTELDRQARPADLPTVIKALSHYQYQDVSQNNNLLNLDKDLPIRTQIHQRMKEKLFEINRRNNLIYFKETASTINLTVGSMPYLLDYKNICTKKLFFINPEKCKILAKDEKHALSNWLKINDYPFLLNTLNKIRLQANRDIKEYGFSQLKLVIVFLRWHNLKDMPEQQINSPLLLVPVTLSKKKGVKDQFLMETQLSETEVNPVLRHHLQQVYDIQLPEKIDASNFDNIKDLYQNLLMQLQQSDKGVNLNFIDTPRIQLIHRTAKRKLADFNRKKRRTGTGLRDFNGISYSYNQKNLDPLGIKIFEKEIKLRPISAPILKEYSSILLPKNTDYPAKSEEINQALYVIDQGENSSAYHWEFDLCAISLANFNYRKMTLVRDYSEIINDYNGAHINFEQLFSADVRPNLASIESTEIAKNKLVLAADPSQQEAVLHAREGSSYVIQGPPGTGKSQTITNLIADAVGHNKAVLFVCEKRAALDVVFHRLQQVGLGELCSLIHDSQSDKKAFIKELKDIYEGWIQQPAGQYWKTKQQQQLTKITNNLNQLRDFSANMSEPIKPLNLFQETPYICDTKAPALRDLIERRIQLQDDIEDQALPKKGRGKLPSLKAFYEAKPLLKRFENRLIENNQKPILAESSLCLLNTEIYQNENFLDDIETRLPRLKKALSALIDLSNENKSLITQDYTWSEWQKIIDWAVRLKGLAQSEQLYLLDSQHPQAQKLTPYFKQLKKRQDINSSAKQKAKNWTNEPTEAAINTAIMDAKKWEHRFFRFFSADWRKTKKLVETNYQGRPKTILNALEVIQHSMISKQEFKASYQKIKKYFKQNDPKLTYKLLQQFWQQQSQLHHFERVFLETCWQNKDNQSLLKLAKIHSQIKGLDGNFKNIFSCYESKTLTHLNGLLNDLEENIDIIPEFSELFIALEQADKVVAKTLRSQHFGMVQIEAAILDRDIEKILRQSQNTYRFDSKKIAELIHVLSQDQIELYDLNVQTAVESAKNNFMADVHRANKPFANMSKAEKDWCKKYNEGRKLLEHEFQKSRAYKAIRTLFSSESGTALRKLKPVWLMSPLSVADILPMDENLFDVVIFDEASQIPLEDAVPSLYRAKQFIVVGDEMQLPPSSFFGAKKSEDDENEMLYLYNLNAASFLDSAVEALPNTLLAWHYRSRHESLIGFCNQAFYNGNLKTIPSVTELTAAKPIEIDVNLSNEEEQLQQAQVEQHVDDLLNRPISFHKMNNSPYSQQCNLGEARYIALLIQELLKRKTTLSIGIVAFSQAQRSEIEEALEKLAAIDSQFRTALDIEEEREEEGQFTGLFIKNLENVQGDERDLMILSICYGPNKQGKMAMNFGPINQTGGEKRLNVIFSRAKKHMAVISSIDSAQITNTWNYGANALRNYLSYARAVSEGDKKAMEAAILEYGNSQETENNLSVSGQTVIKKLAEALIQSGFKVAYNYGQSHLRCHLAVRKMDDTNYKLAIMLDDANHYAVKHLPDRYLTSNNILKAFGWTIFPLLAKDWWKDKDNVLTQIKKQLSHL